MGRRGIVRKQEPPTAAGETPSRAGADGTSALLRLQARVGNGAVVSLLRSASTLRRDGEDDDDQRKKIVGAKTGIDVAAGTGRRAQEAEDRREGDRRKVLSDRRAEISDGSVPPPGWYKRSRASAGDRLASTLTAGRAKYTEGQHGKKVSEQKFLSKQPWTGGTMKVTGDTHESEHVLGYAVLEGDSGLKRGETDEAERLENLAWAYQEVKADHRAHPGTGTKGGSLEDEWRFGPDDVYEAPNSAGWSGDAYRAHQRHALEEGKPGNAVQLNQLGYAANPKFERRKGDVAQQVSDTSYTRMLQGMDTVSFAHKVGDDGQARVHDLTMTAKEKAEAELARRVARGVYPAFDSNGKPTGGWPSIDEENKVRAMYGLPAYQENADGANGAARAKAVDTSPKAVDGEGSA